MKNSILMINLASIHLLNLGKKGIGRAGICREHRVNGRKKGTLESNEKRHGTIELRHMKQLRNNGSENEKHFIDIEESYEFVHPDN